MVIHNRPDSEIGMSPAAFPRTLPTILEQLEPGVLLSPLPESTITQVTNAQASCTFETLEPRLLLSVAPALESLLEEDLIPTAVVIPADEEADATSNVSAQVVAEVTFVILPAEMRGQDEVNARVAPQVDAAQSIRDVGIQSLPGAPAIQETEIGRASCRERVFVGV